MTLVTRFADITRSPGDPKVLSTGPSSLDVSDRLARGLGWLSLGLGIVELVAPARITRVLGIEGKEDLVRAYGVREIGSGILSLSADKQIGLWSRVAGNGLDAATVVTGLRRENPKRDNVRTALGMLVGVMLLDLVVAQAVTNRHSRKRPGGQLRSYSDRSGFPQGVQAARGAARKDFQAPSDMRAAPALASELGSASKA